MRIAPLGLADGRLDGGNGAVLVSRGPAGTTRVLLVNRGATERTTHVLLHGSPATPTRVLLYDDPAGPIVETLDTGPEIVVPAESLVLVEFAPAIPGLRTPARLLLCALLVCASHRVRRSGRPG